MTEHETYVIEELGKVLQLVKQRLCAQNIFCGCINTYFDRFETSCAPVGGTASLTAININFEHASCMYSTLAARILRKKFSCGVHDIVIIFSCMYNSISQKRFQNFAQSSAGWRRFKCLDAVSFYLEIYEEAE